jgi:hypothetical protein
MSKDNDTPEERARVYSRIAPLIMTFYVNNAGKQFHAEDLRRYVLAVEPEIAPGSPDRILRALRQEGRLDYIVIDRRNSLYLFKAVRPKPQTVLKPKPETDRFFRR